jgi:hypothetical protein
MYELPHLPCLAPFSDDPTFALVDADEKSSRRGP